MRDRQQSIHTPACAHTTVWRVWIERHDRPPGDTTLQMIGEEEEAAAVQKSILGKHVGPKAGELGRVGDTVGSP